MYYGFVVTFVVVLVMLIRWQLRFGNLLTSDPDYKLARRAKNFALILWLAAIPLGFVIRPVLALILARAF